MTEDIDALLAHIEAQDARIAELEATVRKWHAAWHDVTERWQSERELLREAQRYAARAIPPPHGDAQEFQRGKALLYERIKGALSERPQSPKASFNVAELHDTISSLGTRIEDALLKVAELTELHGRLYPKQSSLAMQEALDRLAAVLPEPVEPG